MKLIALTVRATARRVNTIPAWPSTPEVAYYRIVAELDVLQADADDPKHLQAETAAELDALRLDRAFKGEL